MENPEERTTSFHDLLQIISARKGLILAGFLSVFVVTVVGSFLMQPIYEASTKILVAPMGIPYFDTALTSRFEERTFLGTQKEIIKGRIISERVVRQLELDKSASPPPGFKIPFIKKIALFAKKIPFVKKIPFIEPTQPDPDLFRTAVADLQRSISVESIRNTNLILVKVKAKGGAESTRIANAVAQTYVDHTLMTIRGKTKGAYDFIAEQVVLIQQQLAQAEESLQRFKEREKTANLTEEATINLNRLAELNALLSTTLAEYSEKDPRVVRAKQEIMEITAKLEKLPEKELELARLTRAVKNSEEIYLMLLKKLEEARISEVSNGENIGTIRIVEPAIPPLKPIKPKKTLYAILGFIVGSIFGFGMAFFAEYQDHSLKTGRDVEQYLKSKILGTIPLTSKKKRKWFLGFGS